MVFSCDRLYAVVLVLRRLHSFILDDTIFFGWYFVPLYRYRDESIVHWCSDRDLIEPGCEAERRFPSIGRGNPIGL